MKHNYTILAAILASGMILTACSGGDKKAAAASGDASVIKIASVGPLSGGLAAVAKDYRDGALLAVEEVNAAGGIEIGGKKHLVELVSEDDAGDPKQGAVVAQKIVDDKGISAVVGHYNSGIMIVTQPIFAKASLIALTVTTNPDVTAKAIKNDAGDTTIFRVVAPDTKQGPALAVYAQKQGYKKIAIIDDATAYGKGVADQVTKKAKELGMDIVYHDSATNTTTDFKGILTKIKAEGADAIMWGGLDDTAAVLAKQTRELGLKSALLMPDGVCIENYMKLTGAAGEGTICSLTALPLNEMPEGVAFKERFEKRFTGQKVQGYAPYGYDSVLTIVDAIKKANSAEPLKVAAAMKDISSKVLSGTMAFDNATGERKDSTVTIVQQKGDAFVTVDKIK